MDTTAFEQDDKVEVHQEGAIKLICNPYNSHEAGLSDVGLKKLLKSHGVITPPQGHWNKVHAGKPVPKCPKVPMRRPGETGRIHVDHRFANVLTVAEPIPSSGPFASAAVPEDLDELY